MRVLARTSGIAAAVLALSLAAAPAATAAVAFPASGGWDCDAYWVDYTASSGSSLSIEPHVANKARAVIARYYGSKIVYYYGPWVTQGITGHKKSAISGATNGTFVGDYWADYGNVRHLLYNGGAKNQYCS